MPVCYQLDHQLIPKPGASFEPGQENTIYLFSLAEFEEQKSLLAQHGFSFLHYLMAKDCRLEERSDSFTGILSIPQKHNSGQRLNCSFCIRKGQLVFIDTDGLAEKTLRLMKDTTWEHPCMERFWFDFIDCLTESDITYLEELENQLSGLEDAVLEETIQHFNQKMQVFRKELLVLVNYYSQMSELCHRLYENESNCFDGIRLRLFRIMADRLARLQNKVMILQEYSMQVRDVYQSTISIRQNNIMKVLTVVTAIFTPLTLIVGWYGMNFYMPEFEWKYGYLLVILLCVVVLAICIWIFKRKKYF